jgi:hypothetical protein
MAKRKQLPSKQYSLGIITASWDQVLLHKYNPQSLSFSKLLATNVVEMVH